MDGVPPREGASKSRARLWPLEAHTAAKHEILRRYLRRWLPIMASWNKRLGYVDCFAGPGEYAGGEPGSPIIALEIAQEFLPSGILKPNQLAMVFIEAKKSRYEHLVDCCAAFRAMHPSVGAIEIDIENGRYEARIADVHARLLKRASGSGAIFYFIDPFGVKGMPHAVLRLLLAPERSEILSTFMYEEINRFLDTPEFEAHLDAMFGEPGWRALRAVSGSERKREMVEFFKARLIDAGAKYVVAFEMRNARNATDYFLLFATKNIRGLEVMKQAMWEVDKSGKFAFSDYTYSFGPMLIEPSPDYVPLQRQIGAEFRHRRNVNMAEIREFVLTRTSFYRFMNEALQPMIARNECYVETSSNERSRPDRDSVMSFVSRTGTPMRLFGDD